MYKMRENIFRLSLRRNRHSKFYVEVQKFNRKENIAVKINNRAWITLKIRYPLAKGMQKYATSIITREMKIKT